MSKRLRGLLPLGLWIWIASGDAAWAAATLEDAALAPTLEDAALAPTLEDAALAPTLDFETFRFDARPQRVYPIVNDGTASLSVDSAMFSPDPGTAADELSFTIRRGGAIVSLPQTLAVGQQLEVIVTAQPRNRIGMVSGRIIVHSSTPGTTDRIVTVTGDATAAIADIPATIDFGGVDIDDDPAMQTATIRNTGSAQLDISIIAVVSSTNRMFTVSRPDTLHIPPHSEASILLTYQPTIAHAPGDFDRAILVVDVTGVLDGPKQAMIELQGHGVVDVGGSCSIGPRGSGGGSGGALPIILAAFLLLRRRRRPT